MCAALTPVRAVSEDFATIQATVSADAHAQATVHLVSQLYRWGSDALIRRNAVPPPTLCNAVLRARTRGYAASRMAMNVRILGDSRVVLIAAARNLMAVIHPNVKPKSECWFVLY
jgi:hypothetical protein